VKFLGIGDGAFCQEVLRVIFGHWGWGFLSGNVACNSWALGMG
jgi:hypothetical protein